MKKYNSKFLVKVACVNFMPSMWYTYYKEKKFWGIIVRKSGVYDDMSGRRLKELPEDTVIKGGCLLEKPYCTLHYVDRNKVTYNFETYNEAKEFSEQFTRNPDWID